MTHDRTPLWLSADLERELRRWAADSGVPLSRVVEAALLDFMARNAVSPDGTTPHGVQAGYGVTTGEDGGECIPCGERRACCRRKVAVPAVVHTSDQGGRTGRYRMAELQDISSSGVGLRFAGDGREVIGVGREIEVLFQLVERMAPVRLACTVCRKAIDGAGVVVGAMFMEPFTGLEEGVTAFT